MHAVVNGELLPVQEHSRLARKSEENQKSPSGFRFRNERPAVTPFALPDPFAFQKVAADDGVVYDAVFHQGENHVIRQIGGNPVQVFRYFRIRKKRACAFSVEAEI